MADQLTPIALFVYNRPAHTRLTLEALARNQGADRSKLFIFADGLQHGASVEDRQKIAEVRHLIKEKEWCFEAEIVESKTNKGLAKSICEGIDYVLEYHDRVIVLEDDLETSRSFLNYMNDALEMYEYQNRVMQVSGFMVKNRLWASQTGFLRVSTSWGWGTWRRAWNKYRSDARDLYSEILEGKERFDLDGFSFHFEELERNVNGELNTWAVRWYASIFLNQGLCLYPKKSLVRNIGFDGSGENCHDTKSKYFNRKSLARRISVKPQVVKESDAYLAAMQRHYRGVMKEWTGTRLHDRVRNKIGRLLGKGH
ncbi:hypothetical protein ACFL1C_00940 [Pseudomonadota bacterium]